MSRSNDRVAIAALGLALIPLVGFVLAGAKDAVCYQGQVMWDTQATTQGGVTYRLQVLCCPKTGPFLARFAPGAPDTDPVWSELGTFRDVAAARAALEQFVNA